MAQIGLHPDKLNQQLSIAIDYTVNGVAVWISGYEPATMLEEK